MSTSFTTSQAYRRMMQLAEEEARSLQDNHLNTHHVVLALTADPESKAGEVLRRNGLTHESMLRQVLRSVGRGETPNPTRFYHDQDIGRMIRIASKIATKYQQKELTPEHFLLALLVFGWSPGAGILRASSTTPHDPEGWKWMAHLGLQLKEIVEKLEQ